MAGTVRVAPEPVEELAGRLGTAGQVAGGTWDSLVGTAEVFNDLTVRVAWDPVGWWRAWGKVGEGMVFAVGNPGDAARAAIDLETLQTNPARWTGQLVPDLLGAAFTGGATVTARRSTDAADTLTDLGRTTTRIPHGDRAHLPSVSLRRATSTGTRFDRYISTLPRGRSRKPHIRVVPDLEHMEALIALIQRRAVADPVLSHGRRQVLVLPDGTEVTVRVSRQHGLTLDVNRHDDHHWKVHIHGS